MLPREETKTDSPHWHFKGCTLALLERSRIHCPPQIQGASLQTQNWRLDFPGKKKRSLLPQYFNGSPQISTDMSNTFIFICSYPGDTTVSHLQYVLLLCPFQLLQFFLCIGNESSQAVNICAEFFTTSAHAQLYLFHKGHPMAACLKGEMFHPLEVFWLLHAIWLF